ncbi:MAG: selenobiotic family peptide radical SAM maturase [Nitrospirae bacterium]|nr:selenobiotic family peptide radical SAM maturase [Nitrospirota bacterium]
MSTECRLSLEDIFPESRKLIPDNIWGQLSSVNSQDIDPVVFTSRLKSHNDLDKMYPYIADLASVELAVHNASVFSNPASMDEKKFALNPTLKIVPVSWMNLPSIIIPKENNQSEPVKKDGFVVVYKQSGRADIIVEDATDEMLLALKIVVEGLDLRDVAKAAETTVWPLYCALRNSTARGALVEQQSKIRRSLSYPRGKNIDQGFFSSDVFTLQWHITQSCDLHCRHCYDRSDRANVSFDSAVKILDQLYDFCTAKNVTGQVSFSGGNPFLHPDFKKIYSEASFRGFALAVLGNPVSSEALEDIVSIEKPVFYQVSLEGLAEYNNYVRGEGHFDRTLVFLDLLKEFDIYSMVMLTLSRANMDQVIPLARTLQGRADLFTFNRLSIVGEAHNMLLPDKEEYRKFLQDFLQESEVNDVLTCKDNLINILLRDKCKELFGGCAGHGCSAAFNFLSLLPDGEVHACRKFPSKIGDINTYNLLQIYDSEIAEKYRMGPTECAECEIRPVCGGCLAVANSFGLDIFRQKDPMCFMKDNSSN